VLPKMLGFIGATVGSAIGWWVGSLVGFMTAFFVSTVFGGIGIYIGKRIADNMDI
jgi:hypothetical protein